MQYAPVIIPTLNRYEHFKRCLESLEKCNLADKTTVFVGLDFPPSDKYVEGWKKIDEYLKKKESNNTFGKLVVSRRNHNCGLSGNESNYSLLYNIAAENSDTIIAAEDDNEFAPAFLIFMNKALEAYRDNRLIASVCAYSQPAFNKDGINKNQVFVCDNCAWGYGMWKEKELLIDTFDINWCQDVMNSFSKVRILMRHYPMLVSMIINMLRMGMVYGDTRRTCANILYGTFQVRPKISLVRNWGNDGSGVNCKKIIDTSSEYLDMREYFDFTNCIVERTKELDNAVYNILLPKNIVLKYMKVVKIWCKYFYYILRQPRSKNN